MINLNKNRIFEVSYILLLPIALLIFYRFTPFNNTEGTIDAWQYFSYIHNFEDLIKRFGLLYYAVRFGHIFPHMLAVKIFGNITGYIIFVYSMYLLAGIPLYLVFRKYFSILAAVSAYTIFVSSVWSARTILWTYTDATAVPYLIAVTGLVFLNTKHLRSINLGIGLLTGLAVNSNAFALVIAGLNITTYLILNKEALWQSIRSDAPWVLAGFFFVFVVGSIGYFICCNTWDYISPTIEMIRWSNMGGGGAYRVQVEELFKIGSLYLPPFLIVVLAMQILTSGLSQRRLQVASVVYLMAVVVFFVWYEFVRNAAVLEKYFYFSYLLVPAIFCIALVPVGIAEKSKRVKRIYGVSIACFILMPALCSKLIVSGINLPISVVITGSLIFIVLLLMSAERVMRAPAVILYATVLQLFWMSPHIFEKSEYAALYGKSNLGMSRFRLGLKFIDQVPKYNMAKKPLFFWYRNNDELAMSLQSTYLWNYTRIMEYNESTHGLPNPYGLKIDMLQGRSSLILFDIEESTVKKGIEVLRQLDLSFDVKNIERICEYKICYTLAILDVYGMRTEAEKKWPQGQAVSAELEWYLPGLSAVIPKGGGQLSVTTLPQSWSYAAVGLINYNMNEQPTGVIRILLSVKDSVVGLGFLGVDETQFLKRVPVYPFTEPQELYFYFSNLNEVKKIVLQSWDKAESAEIILYEFETKKFTN